MSRNFILGIHNQRPINNMVAISVLSLMALYALRISTSAFADQRITLRERHVEIGEVQYVAPYWIKPEQMDQEVMSKPLNTNLKLKCLASGIPKPDIEWMKDGVKIELISRPAHLPAYSSKPDQYKLRIPSLSKEDEGEYNANANAFGTLNHTFIVETQDLIRQEPVLVQQSPNQTVIPGMSVTFKCKFRADLATKVGWLKPSPEVRESSRNFGRIQLDHFEVIRNVTTGEPMTGEHLEMRNVTLDDAGFYFCIGQTNTETAQGTVHLTVLDRNQSILQTPQNLTIRAGDIAIFSCRTHIELHKYTKWVKIQEAYAQVLARGTEVYRMENVTKEDEGMYACLVGNDQASFQEVAYLEVTDHDRTPARPFGGASRRLSVTAGIISLFTTVLMVIITIYLLRRCQQERFKKHQAIETAQSITRWTKKVIIEHQAAHDDANALILAPSIHIKKQSLVVNRSSSSSSYLQKSENEAAEFKLPPDPKWEFPRSQLQLGQLLGEGASGKVVKGEAKNIKADGQTTIVAVKMLREGHTDQQMIDLVSEMEIMKLIGFHDNIARLLGVCTQEGPLYVIVEHAKNGNLRDYLRQFTDHTKPTSQRAISVRQLISFAHQVSTGMDFLSSRKCIHRDLAARNVLLSEELNVKIADFGLARDVQAVDYYRKTGDGCLPVKWMAPETLFHRRYTTQSDVWSFGVLLWEIMTLGANPYPSVNVERLFCFLRDGHRMECPQNCPLEVYMIMRDCWHADPVSRPTFTKLANDTDNILHCEQADYLDINLPQDKTFSGIQPLRGPLEIKSIAGYENEWLPRSQLPKRTSDLC